MTLLAAAMGMPGAASEAAAQPATTPTASATLPPAPAPVQADEYAQRRGQVMEVLGPDSLLILLAPPPAVRNGDVTWPFRQDDDLLWLTGVEEPDTALVLVPGEGRFREVLFAPDRDPLAEVWTGPIPEHEELATGSGIAEVHSAGEALGFVDAALAGRPWGESDLYGFYREPSLPRFLEAVREGRGQIWLKLGEPGLGTRSLAPLGGPTTAEQRLARRIRESFPEVAVRDAAPILAGLRETKSPAEVALVQHAIDITEAGIRRAMRRARTAESENQVQATLEHAYRDLGADHWGFPSIVAAGPNTTVLHYEDGQGPVDRGGLVLLDVGAEYGGYTADVSRTFPADGTFSAEQAAIYGAVLRTSQALIPKVRPGVSFRDLHLEALELLGRELLELGLVSEADPRQTEMYFLHGLGHPLGLQVHDVFDRSRQLEPGMIWTVEPGLYVRPADVEASETFQGLDEAAQAGIRTALERYAGIGVRIEDDVLVTAGAPRVLSDGAPRTMEEIEAWMSGGDGTEGR